MQVRPMSDTTPTWHVIYARFLTRLQRITPSLVNAGRLRAGTVRPCFLMLKQDLSYQIASSIGRDYELL
ncbi:hypothetical protein COCSADRAFT_207762 [Bipolaris sorokiniana ND90Pr]|uniref:Uncharacterized protein n=1 Tax=Cochliobolus sativus (strain ND90Pr / ATCC 201652) TaxID=665912 RepID=M2RRN4_COCSN|nr:uncharacterized protein COCSADRAFT_207762 [Bipolaris sorokiniana ND90Pr]EMD69234.1 hypothetical protein COCSADRAFT_207762 [Bipolaris sorokiniana ND90Pr]